MTGPVSSGQMDEDGAIVGPENDFDVPTVYNHRQSLSEAAEKSSEEGVLGLTGRKRILPEDGG